MEDGKEGTKKRLLYLLLQKPMLMVLYAQKPVANPTDLLPNDANSKWGELSVSNSVNTQTFYKLVIITVLILLDKHCVTLINS